MFCPRTVVPHTFSKISCGPRAVLDSLRLRPWPLGATPQGGRRRAQQGLLVVQDCDSPGEGVGPVKIHGGGESQEAGTAGVKILRWKGACTFEEERG